MIYPPEGPQGGLKALDQNGYSTGLDSFHIRDDFTFTGPQGGIVLTDKNGYAVPTGAFKMYDDQIGVMVLDKGGSWVPVTLFNESSNSFIRCGQGTVASGSQGDFYNTHKVGPDAGIVCVYYDTYTQPDQVEVYYNGVLKAFTYDVSDPLTPAVVAHQGCLYFYYDPVGGNNNIQVRVHAPSSGTNWWYNVVCPTGKCNNKLPKTGSKTYTLSLGGNCCAGGTAEQNQETDTDSDCHYTLAVCGCHSRKKKGKLQREVVTVSSVTKPANTTILSYTMKEYKASSIYCSTPPETGFKDCTTDNPALITRPLSTISSGTVLWDSCSEAAGCEIPNHNIFFRFCRTPFNGAAITGNPQATITLTCTITEVETCP